MTALVLGASGSLGSALVTALRERDEVVVGVSRGSQPRGLQCDSWIRVDSYENFVPPSAAWNRVFVAFGSFQVAPFVESSTEDITLQIQSNITAQILATHRVLKSLDLGDKRRRDIVFIGSTSAYTGFSGSAVYCATKFALRGFIEAMNAEWSSSNVRFWLASMGSMNNDMGRRVPGVVAAHLLEPLEVARDIVHTVVRETAAFQPEFTIRRRWVP